MTAETLSALPDYSEGRRSRGTRRVLMVAAAFPPAGGPGVQRSAKFAKYLPRFNWRPAVWTLDHAGGLPIDPTLLGDLPAEVAVHRWGDDGVVAARRRQLCGGRPEDSLMHRAIDKINRRLTAWWARSSLPDDLVGWARTSVRPLCRLIDRDGIEVIYSTFSPASNHLLGFALKRRTGLPWVADFRDLWTDDYRYRERSRKRRLAHRRLEQEILETADMVIGVTERQTEILANHVPLEGHKFVTITNGFDPDDFAGPEPHKDEDEGRFVLAHVGRFDRWRSSEAWFAGLRRFVERLGRDRGRVAFRVVGHIGANLRERLCVTGVEAVFTGYKTHQEAVEEMRSADALLLHVPEGPNAASVIPGKLFEYLAAGRPILLVGPQAGEAERIVRQCAAGVAAGFDETAIADALERMYRAWESGTPMGGCPAEQLGSYSRRELADTLATILDQVADTHGVCGQFGPAQPALADPLR